MATTKKTTVKKTDKEPVIAVKTLTKKTNKVELVKAEYDRLWNVFSKKKIDSNVLEVVKNLIEDVAFLTVETNLIKDKINLNGWTEEFKNGSQCFQRETADSKSYLSASKQKASFLKQLTDLISKDSPAGEAGDEFDNYLNRRKKK